MVYTVHCGHSPLRLVFSVLSGPHILDVDLPSSVLPYGRAVLTTAGHETVRALPAGATASGTISCSEGPQVCCYLVFLLAAYFFFDFVMSKFTCRQTRQGRKSDDWRETQLSWMTLWAERAVIDVVQEA